MRALKACLRSLITTHRDCETEIFFFFLKKKRSLTGIDGEADGLGDCASEDYIPTSPKMAVKQLVTIKGEMALARNSTFTIFACRHPGTQDARASRPSQP